MTMEVATTLRCYDCESVISYWEHEDVLEDILSMTYEELLLYFYVLFGGPTFGIYVAERYRDKRGNIVICSVCHFFICVFAGV